MRTNTKDDDDTVLPVLRDGETGRVRLMLKDGKTVRVTDARGGTGLHRPGFRVADQRDGDCYRAYDEAISMEYLSHRQQQDAGPPGSYPYSAAAEGTSCTVDGRPGTLVRRGNFLVCRPVPRAGNARDHRILMDKLYLEADAVLSEQWRTR